MTDKRIYILAASRFNCPVCGEKHREKDGHNAMSLYYRYIFFSKHGRFPTEDDAKK